MISLIKQNWNKRQVHKAINDVKKRLTRYKELEERGCIKIALISELGLRITVASQNQEWWVMQKEDDEAESIGTTFAKSESATAIEERLVHEAKNKIHTYEAWLHEARTKRNTKVFASGEAEEWEASIFFLRIIIDKMKHP